MHGREQIRRWLENLPTPEQEDDMFGGSRRSPSTMGSPTSGPTPLGGNDPALRAKRQKLEAEVQKNGVRPRAADSPRRRGR